MPPGTLAEIIAPISVEDFLASSWGHSFLFIEGNPEKFSDLLPWDELNRLLAQHRLDFPRLRVAKDGDVARESTARFLNYEESSRGLRTPRIDATELTRALRDGATLVVDAIDEMVLPIQTLAENLERSLGEPVQVNAYAGWGESLGFDLHWDDHDVLIAQISGRKRWEVRGITREFPLRRDLELDQAGPEKPIWEGIMEAGDFLYIPRGWWHVAQAVNEPTLHLTIGVTKRTGIDLLGWLQDQLRASRHFRMDLPRFASRDQQLEHIQHLKTDLLDSWDETLLDRYFTTRLAHMRQRPHFSLPFGARPEGLPPHDNFYVRFSGTGFHGLEVDHEEKTVRFSAFGREWKFSSLAEGILSQLESGVPCHAQVLVDSMKPMVTRGSLRSLLAQLVKEGLVYIIPASDHPSQSPPV